MTTPETRLRKYWTREVGARAPVCGWKKICFVIAERWIVDSGACHFATTPNPTYVRRVRSFAVSRSELVHWQGRSGPKQAGETRNLSSSRRLARHTDHLRSFFLRVITHHTHAHTPRRFCGHSGTMSSITSPQACFVGSLGKTRPWPRTRAKRPSPTLVLSHSFIYVSIQLPAEWLGVWGPFVCLSLPSGSEMGRSTAKIGVSSYPWSFFGRRAAPVAR